jgi:hypothetical protein
MCFLIRSQKFSAFSSNYSVSGYTRRRPPPTDKCIETATCRQNSPKTLQTSTLSYKAAVTILCIVFGNLTRQKNQVQTPEVLSPTLCVLFQDSVGVQLRQSPCPPATLQQCRNIMCYYQRTDRTDTEMCKHLSLVLEEDF